jgi:phospholipase/lecithinase/hemolysin
VDKYTWEGRISNGPVAVEVLAERLDVSLTTYAFLAATSGYLDEYGERKKGLLSQIDQFEADLNGKKADADSLYFIFVSLFDFITPWERECNGDITHDQKIMTDHADQAVINIADAVTRLAQLGARRFMVVNSFDLLSAPLILEYKSVDVATAFQSRMKSELPGKMENLAKQLNVTIEIFDWIAASNIILSNPDKYGLAEIHQACVGDEVCESPDEYFFWSLVDLTHRVHEIMGEAMAEQLSK